MQAYLARYDLISLSSFRFLLDASGDYTKQLNDPDVSFDWDWIEQVLLYGMSSCPICLDSPTAARIARCGHVFCLGCILHCLQEHKACPICWDCILGPRDLKPVKVLESKTYNAGDSIDLCLVHRNANSMFALPASNATSTTTNTSLIPWNTAPLAMQFSRFMLAKPEYMEAEYDKDAECIGKAIEDVDEDNELAALLAGLDLVHTHKERHQQQRQQQQPSSNNNHHSHHRIHQQNGRGEACQPEYHFYQEANGQFIFLNSRDIRVLKHEFGDYHLFPSQIRPVIRTLEEIILTEEHRHRSKYLGHLPIGCTITLISVDLSGIVSKETLDIFVEHSIPEKQPETSEEAASEEPTSQETIRELVAEEEWSDEEEMLQHVLRISALEYHKESTGREATTSETQAQKQLDHDNDDHTYDDWEWEEYIETSKSIRQRR
ncbi:hypothetical protein K492DRAFT_183442 [Lichtheimia hyalospora FSU 10163]|nr:hypothetical protein K492DRAFT_183442 [Lichtheimia hyalospora FSU 10163]